MDIDKALELTRLPGSIFCGKCQQELFSPMDKLSLHLYGMCLEHIRGDSVKEINLLKIAENI